MIQIFDVNKQAFLIFVIVKQRPTLLNSFFIFFTSSKKMDTYLHSFFAQLDFILVYSNYILVMLLILFQWFQKVLDIPKFLILASFILDSRIMICFKKNPFF